MSDTPFLSRLAGAEQKAGVYLLRSFLSKPEADELFVSLNDDRIFPWDRSPVLYGGKLSQHAYQFDRSQRQAAKWPGLGKLDALCERIEQHMDGKISFVFCNRFADSSHALPWHTDTYGEHIIVLSLGHGRKVQFRDLKTKSEVVDVLPKAGDLYFMPLGVNDTHEHRVCEAASEGEGTRLSFVFFFKAPKYAKAFSIGTKDKVKGFFEGLFARG
uniref:Fe2OG dioxygenase domain-containing protein n=1 Tax=Chromera velia CCMP2878 TaxID=1169474 RepID=A0A0G4GPS2_9ALVE|eukprot:Cvel_5017.t1-p1 / transcript=Cvel_5017.t1 / gene=Cvel_5017 / organism=Chromera_velia_CCMP2878 / gene_product=hypothetical protein / transcript_product=hypothetical protein / location=Cvel_scaffold228:5424-6065(-) / protein_length=214 / sequence_SO=supercontig / SO=protein_coding / is_pseudo=false